LPNFTYFSITNQELERVGNTDPTMAPSGIFKSRNGKFMALAVATDEQLKGLFSAMGQKKLAAEYKESFDRLHQRNARELHRIAEEWVSTKDSTEIVSLAKEYRFPVAEVMDDFQLANDEWRRQRGSVVSFKDDIYRQFVMPGPSAMLSKTPGRVKWLSRPLGYHNRYILKTFFGLSEEEIKKLERERVIGYWDDRPGIKPPVYYDIEKDPIFNYKG